MDFKQASKLASGIRNRYEKLEKKLVGKNWTRGDIARGFIGDIGAAFKLMMAEDGLRTIDGSKEKLNHEMGDIIWSILVLCDKYNIDPEDAFQSTIDELEERITKQEQGQIETSFSQH